MKGKGYDYLLLKYIQVGINVLPCQSQFTFLKSYGPGEDTIPICLFVYVITQ